MKVKIHEKISLLWEFVSLLKLRHNMHQQKIHNIIFGDLYGNWLSKRN
jgi:hypothetical protein